MLSSLVLMLKTVALTGPRQALLSEVRWQPALTLLPEVLPPEVLPQAVWSAEVSAVHQAGCLAQ